MASNERLLRFRVVWGGRSLDIEARSSWNVLFVRQLVCQQLQLTGPEKYRLVYAGQALGELLPLSEVRPDDGTALHLVMAPAPASDTSGAAADRQWCRFYVFCYDCGRLARGKLRLRCATCPAGGVLLRSRPASFADLRASELRGRCPDCSADDRLTFGIHCAEGEARAHRCVPLPMVRDPPPPPEGLECAACFEPAAPALQFACEHALCLPCFAAFCGAKADGGFRLHARLGYTLFCPAWSPACGPDAAVEDPHHFLLAGRDFYSELKARAAEQLVAREGGGFCPNPRCGDAWTPPAGAPPPERLLCRSCEWEICGRCRERAHPDRDCLGSDPYSEDHLSPASSDRPASPSSLASLRAVRKSSRQCPQCRAPTERTGGCMHMTCSRCQFDWCWLCRQEWSEECRANHWFL